MLQSNYGKKQIQLWFGVRWNRPNVYSAALWIRSQKQTFYGALDFLKMLQTNYLFFWMTFSTIYKNK